MGIQTSTIWIVANFSNTAAGYRLTAGLGQPERGERRGTLVDPHVQPDQAAALSLAEGHGQRRAAPAGGPDRLPQPAPDQLVGERDPERGGRIHRSHAPAASGMSGRYLAAASARSRQGPGSASQRASWAGSTAGR